MSETKHIEEWIVRYLQHEIGEDDLRQLEAWLEEDPANKAYFFQLKRIADLKRYPLFAGEEEREAGWRQLTKRMEEGTRGESKRPSRRFSLRRTLSAGWRSVGRYAAVVCVVVAIGWGISEYRVRQVTLAPASSPVVALNEIRVPQGGRANTLILSDGSKVILNASSVFRYPAAFDSGRREVYLEGEAYFEVTHDSRKPFVVKLRKQHITVLGTTFNIEAYNDRPYTLTTLLTGSIRLEAFNEQGEAMSQMLLSPNQQALSDNRTGSVSLRNIDASLANAWTRNEYKFKNEPLESIFRKLERRYDVRIFLENDSLKQIRYTGTFSYEQDILDVLNIVNYEKQFVFKRAGKNIFISKR